MKFPWFKRHGMFYIPVSVTGWICLLAGLTFGVYAFINIDSSSHSGSDTLINFVFVMLGIVAVYSLIAFATSRESKR